jgi:hypothetical protein
MPDEHAQSSAELLFGGRTQELHDDPEVQGRKIALIVTSNTKVQKPPNCLDRMHSTRGKQVAYNQRILKAGEEFDGINCDVADFLSEMSPDPEEPVIICVNAGASMKRHEQHLGGQLWMQGSRMMAATNIPFSGTSNDATSAMLTAVAEAVDGNTPWNWTGQSN